MTMELDKEMFDEFVAEGREHLETIEDDFLTLEEQKDNPDSELVNKVFRAIHTIKGVAGFLGLGNINKLSHVMETLLSMMRNGEIRPESKFVDPLLEGVDMINAMFDDIENSNEMDISGIHDKLSKLLSSETPKEVKKEMETSHQLSDLKGHDLGFEITEFTLKNIPEDKYLYILKYDLIEFTKSGGKSPVALIKHLMKTGEIVEARIHTESEDLSKGLPEGPLQYDVLYSTKKAPNQIRKTVELEKKNIIQVDKATLEDKVIASMLEERKNVEVTDIQTPKEEAQITPGPEIKPIVQQPVTTLPEEIQMSEEIVEKKKTTGSKAASKTSSGSDRSSGSIRINVEILDQLMMLAGELVLVRNQQLINADKSDAITRSTVQRLDIVTSELQETIMRTRMQPIGNMFGKFPRIVRDLGNKLGKQIELTITGSEVELDKTILESLTDPLTHLVRNCCDHGIELPADRVKSGKPEKGNVILHAYHEGGQINIEIKDDGKGINVELIKKKALEKNLKSETELAQMSEKEIFSLILLPGFSTVETISDVSGRGVGMDVVKSNIEKLGGIIDIDSKFGEGSKMHLRLPLTLAIIPCLLIVVGEYRYAIPQINLVELVSLYDEEVGTKVECAGNKEVYRLRGSLLPLTRLSEILNSSAPFTEDTKAEITEKYRKQNEDALLSQKDSGNGGPGKNLLQSLNFAVLKIGSCHFGLVVDQVLGTEEIVVKPMHPALKSLSCYSGATVMGDGKVALILDIDGIARYSGIELSGRTRDVATEETHKGDETQSILIFKSGEKEQFSVALPLIRRIEHIDVSRIEQVGNKSFVTIDGVSTLIVRLDQHLSVSPVIEREEMFLLLPKHIKKPFGILISSLVDIAEVSMELNEDSYMEDGLLGTAIVLDHITLFIDIYKLIEIAEPTWFASRREKTPLSKTKNRILLVEDTPFFRQLIKGYLIADGYKVDTAVNGQEGLSLFNEGEFDLIISDIEMPIMDGFDFIKNVRSSNRQNNIPAVAVTALDSDQDRENAKVCGFDKYETKFNRETFLTTIADAIQTEHKS